MGESCRPSEALSSAALATATSATITEAAGGFAATAAAKRHCVGGAARPGPLRESGTPPHAAANIPGARVRALRSSSASTTRAHVWRAQSAADSAREGAPAYLAATERFYKNWSLPTEHCERLAAMFSGWAREVMTLPGGAAHARAASTCGLTSRASGGERRARPSGPRTSLYFWSTCAARRSAGGCGALRTWAVPVSMGGVTAASATWCAQGT